MNYSSQVKHHLFHFINVLLISNFFGCRHARSSSLESYSVPVEAEISSIRMGQGFNSLGGSEYSSELSRCVESSALGSLGGSPAPRIVIRIETVDSQQSLESSLSRTDDLNASLSKEKVVLFKGGFKSSSKFNFVSNEKTSFVILNVSSTFAPEVMENFSIAPTVISRFSSSPETFFKTCGDRFVSGVRKAAGVVAVMRCESASKTEKDAIESKIKVEGGFKALTASADIQTLIDNIRGKSTDGCHMEVDSFGGVGNYDFKDKTTLVESAVNYVTKSTPATATPVEFETMPYATIIDAEFNTKVLSKIDLDLVEQRKYATHKNKIIADIIQGVSRLGSAADSQKNLFNYASAVIEGAREDLKRCFSRIYDPEACREKTVVRLPDGVILKPMPKQQQ